MRLTTGTVYKEGALATVPLFEKNGILCRTDTYDAQVVNELRSYTWLDVKGKAVLDIGANIGVFTRWAVENCARSVVAVEPEANNFELLEANTSPVVTRIQAAVTYKGDKPVSLYLSESGKNPGNTSTVHFQGRAERTVQAVGFKALLRQYRPSVLKIDCEGAEYEFLRDPLPAHVKQVAMELHLNKRGWRATEAQKLINLFKGWECVVQPTIGEANWHTLAGWRR